MREKDEMYVCVFELVTHDVTKIFHHGRVYKKRTRCPPTKQEVQSAMCLWDPSFISRPAVDVPLIPKRLIVFPNTHMCCLGEGWARDLGHRWGSLPYVSSLRWWVFYLVIDKGE